MHLAALPQTGEPEWGARYAELPDPATEPELFAELAQALLLDLGPFLASSPTARGTFDHTTYWLADLPVGIDVDVELVRDLAQSLADVDTALTVRVSYRVADRCVRQARMNTALRFVDACLTLVLANDPARAHLQLLRAEILRAQSRWDGATEQLDELAQELDAGAGEAWESAYAHLVTARMHGLHVQIAVEVGVLHRASEHLALEEGHARASGDPRTWLAFLNHKAEFLRRSDRERELLEFLNGPSAQAPEGRSWLPDDAALLALHRGLAHSVLARNDPAHRELARNAFVAALDTSDPLRLARVRRELAMDALMSGEHERASAEIAAARAELNEVVGGAPIEQLVFQRTAEVSVALSVGSERAELEALRADLQTLFGRHLDVWTRLSRPEGGADFFGLRERRQVACELLRSTLALEAEQPEQRALEVLLELQSRGTRALAEGLRVESVADLRAALGLTRRHGCLLLFPGTDHLIVCTIDTEAVRFEMVRGYQDLRRAGPEIAGRSRRHAAERDDSDRGRRRARQILAVARALSDRFLARSLAAMDSWELVTVVGTEYLKGLPIELMVLPDGRLFGERWAVSSVPSLPVAASMARRSLGREFRYALDLIVALEPSETLQREFGIEPYPIRERDLAPLGRAFDGRSVRTTYGPTPARLQQLDLDGSAIVHVLAHGVYDASQVRPAALVLAGGSRSESLLGCDELERLTLGGVAVLSACGAAVGPSRLGDDELAHLGGAVLRAGARSVVLSGASIDLDWSVRFLALAYAEMAQGAPVAEAVRRVREREAAADRDAWSRLDAAQFQVLGVATAGL